MRVCSLLIAVLLSVRASGSGENVTEDRVLRRLEAFEKDPNAHVDVQTHIETMYSTLDDDRFAFSIQNIRHVRFRRVRHWMASQVARRLRSKRLDRRGIRGKWKIKLENGLEKLLDTSLCNPLFWNNLWSDLHDDHSIIAQMLDNQTRSQALSAMKEMSATGHLRKRDDKNPIFVLFGIYLTAVVLFVFLPFWYSLPIFYLISWMLR
ncbi:MAG: hypothetical protein SGCHY_002585 [Lobulomycetales sp.]